MVDTRRARHRTNIKQYTHIGVENRSKGIEEPPMRVDLQNYVRPFDRKTRTCTHLLLILLLETKEDLNGDDPLLGGLEIQIGVDTDLSGVLPYVGRHWFLFATLFH